MDMRDWYGEMISAGVLGRALLAVGRVDDGFAVLDQSIQRASELPLDQAAAGRGGADRHARPRRPGCRTEPVPAPPIGDEPVHEIGWLDWHVATALTDLQRGAVAEARASGSSISSTATSRTCYAASALALARAADGDADGARTLCTEGGGARARPRTPTASWRCSAAALGQARIGDHEVADAWLRTARELADGTEDHLLAAVVRIAEAHAGQRARPCRCRRRPAPGQRRPRRHGRQPARLGHRLPPRRRPPCLTEQGMLDGNGCYGTRFSPVEARA